jgi:predicted NAD/FAD-binding protein
MSRKRIAIIGGGISGLTAAYYLSKKKRYDIVLFEAQAQLGGHAHTYTHDGTHMDTTVVAFHEEAYRHFVELVKELGVYEETQHFRQDLCFHSNLGVNYLVTYSLRTILMNPLKVFRTLMALKRFSRAVVRGTKDPLIDSMTFESFLKQSNMSEHEIKYLVLPLIHMFVGRPAPAIREMPARFLVDHIYFHKLLHHSSLRAWRGWKHGTGTYISKLAEAIEGTLRTSVPIESVQRQSNGTYRVTVSNETPEEFDLVIMATPPASTKRIVKDLSAIEQRLLGPWESLYLPMEIHTDSKVLAKSRLHRSFWNAYVDSKSGQAAGSYLISKLQSQVSGDIIVSWAAIQPLEPRSVIARKDVEITQYCSEALKSHKHMQLLNQQNHGLYYCGAHMSYGWHESAVESGLQVVEQIEKDNQASTTDSDMTRESHV